MDKPIALINDWCLYRAATGIPVYLRRLLAHWPPDSPVRPVGFWERLPRLSTALGASHASLDTLELRPLCDFLAAARPSLRPPFWMRRTFHKGYAFAFRNAFRSLSASVYFEPNSLAMSCDAPTVTSLLDLSVVEHPEWHPPDRVAQWGSDLPRSLSATSHWIVPSQFTRDRACRLLGLPPERVTVIPLAARALGPCRSSPSGGRPPLLPQGSFFLHVGTLEPRKNIRVLLDAWRNLPESLRRSHRLVLVGPLGWGEAAFWTDLRSHPAAREVLAAGRVPDPVLASLLDAAAALLAPSRYEGFGLPLLEAMARHVPVVCSTAHAFTEIACDVALAVDPDDVAGWTSAIRKAAEDEAWRAESADRGAARAARFSWRSTACLHAEILARHASS
ncbi:MAG: glycosyltransferase family 1 protein [Planctomycetota bacterium]